MGSWLTYPVVYVFPMIGFSGAGAVLGSSSTASLLPSPSWRRTMLCCLLERCLRQAWRAYCVFRRSVCMAKFSAGIVGTFLAAPVGAGASKARLGAVAVRSQHQHH